MGVIFILAGRPFQVGVQANKRITRISIKYPGGVTKLTKTFRKTCFKFSGGHRNSRPQTRHIQNTQKEEKNEVNEKTRALRELPLLYLHENLPFSIFSARKSPMWFLRSGDFRAGQGGIRAG